MEMIDAVAALSALAQDNRLDIYRLLVQAGVSLPRRCFAAAEQRRLTAQRDLGSQGRFGKPRLRPAQLPTPHDHPV